MNSLLNIPYSAFVADDSKFPFGYELVHCIPTPIFALIASFLSGNDNGMMQDEENEASIMALKLLLFGGVCKPDEHFPYDSLYDHPLVKNTCTYFFSKIEAMNRNTGLLRDGQHYRLRNENCLRILVTAICHNDRYSVLHTLYHHRKFFWRGCIDTKRCLWTVIKKCFWEKNPSMLIDVYSSYVRLFDTDIENRPYRLKNILKKMDGKIALEYIFAHSEFVADEHFESTKILANIIRNNHLNEVSEDEWEPQNHLKHRSMDKVFRYVDLFEDTDVTWIILVSLPNKESVLEFLDNYDVQENNLELRHVYNAVPEVLFALHDQNIIQVNTVEFIEELINETKGLTIWAIFQKYPSLRTEVEVFLEELHRRAPTFYKLEMNLTWSVDIVEEEIFDLDDGPVLTAEETKDLFVRLHGNLERYAMLEIFGAHVLGEDRMDHFRILTSQFSVIL